MVDFLLKALVCSSGLVFTSLSIAELVDKRDKKAGKDLDFSKFKTTNCSSKINHYKKLFDTKANEKIGKI